MPARFRFLLLYFLIWTAFFQVARALFLLFHAGQARQLPAGTLLQTFWYGARMDLSMAAYLSLPVALMLLLSFVLRPLRRALPYQVYSAVLLLPILLIIVADLEVFRQWGFRLDATPLKYLHSPREAWASVSHLPVGWYLLGLLLLLALLVRGTWVVLRRMATALSRSEKVQSGLPLLLLLTGALVIPLRGGLQQTPINQSSVYFSTRNFANQAAINVPWNFLFGVFAETNSTSDYNPYNYLPPPEAQRISDSLLRTGSSSSPVLNNRRPNVVLVIWESFTAKVVDTLIDGRAVTPCFNRLKGEGLYFNNAWASGDRTDKGVPAILSGYPALPQTSIIRIPAKGRKLATLGGMFREAGYHSSFFYGGEPEFANLKSYLLHAGFDPLIEKSDFATRDQNSKWGAHDGVVADRVMQELQGARQPFFATWLTLSSHEPFETPVPSVFTGTDDTHQFLNSLHYTDSVVYHFVKRCQAQPWWGNTLLIIVADHGHVIPYTGNELERFRIPLLLLGGALNRKGIDPRPVSQLDIAATLAAQTGHDPRQFPFSRDLFAARPSWAFFTFNNGFGYIDSSVRLLYDNVGRQPLMQQGAATVEIRKAQALQQQVYQDYLEK